MLASDRVRPGTVGLNNMQRKELDVTKEETVQAVAFQPDLQRELIATLVLEADFLQKKSTSTEKYDTDQMAMHFQQCFSSHCFTVNQGLNFDMPGKKKLLMRVRQIQVADVEAMAAGKKVEGAEVEFGVIKQNTQITFERKEGSTLILTGKAKTAQSHTSLFSADWDFQKMGIGGLDDEFVKIVRRAFASRIFPPEVMEHLGLTHIKGILLYGPPGTGKTLMARQIGKMLNAREPKIVNGPEILDKYVGESEANVRKLFADAEEEERRMRPTSGLHIIIFDEIDAICKARGSVAGNTGGNDTVVNQLLSKIDGVEQLNNILVIGMTNRRDMMDEALLRPGRFEIQVEIALPGRQGRLDILRIKTANMKKHGKLAEDVDLGEVADLTKNFSGAELEGLVKAASSCALKSYIHMSNKIEVDPKAIDKIKVCRKDFVYSLENDVKPSLGTSDEPLNKFIERGVIEWGDIGELLEKGRMFVNQARSPQTSSRLCMLLEGAPNAGTSALAAYLAKNSEFPFVKVITSRDMVGFTESAKCLRINKIFDDAYRSEMSCIFLNDIEQLMGYSPVGPRYQSLVLDALYSLLSSSPPKGRKLLVICSSKRREVLKEFGLLPLFTAVLRVPYIQQVEDVRTVLQSSQVMTPQEIGKVVSHLSTGGRVSVGVKKLLALQDALAVLPNDPQQRVNTFCALCEDEEVYTHY